MNGNHFTLNHFKTLMLLIDKIPVSEKKELIFEVFNNSQVRSLVDKY